jgi:hypothetical protein
MSIGRRRIVAGVLIGAFVLAVLLTRAFWDGRQALADGDAALARGDEVEAVTRWRRAARWYVPGAPHVATAYRRLQGLAMAAENEQRPIALEAWQGIRSSILATRSFYTPYPELLAEANRHIAALMARQPGPPDAGGTEEARRAWHLALLERDESPSTFWSILALLGFAAWVGGGFYFAWRGIGSDDKLVRRQAARAGVVILVGLVVWMLSLYKA